MSFRELPRSTPADEGVAAAGIEHFLDAVAATAGVELHSLMILRHDVVIASGWWAPYAKDYLHLLYSLSKSFTSTALGLAAAEGRLSLDDTVISHFPELDVEVTDRRSRSMLVRHLAAMSSGHREDTWAYVTATDPTNPVRAFLQLPPTDDPGTVFAYNQSCTYTLATIVRRVTGLTLTEYLRGTVLDPIGSGAVAWAQQPVGQDQGFSGLHATTDTIARLGQLYLWDGIWLGTRVLPEGWVKEATRTYIATDSVDDAAVSDKPDWKLGYGYQFWCSSNGYRADGAFGQFCLVLPEYDAVIAMTGQNSDTQSLLNLVWKELLPAFADAPIALSTADQRLQRRMAELEFTPFRADQKPPSDTTSWAGAVFLPAGGTCADQPSMDRVEVMSSAKGWEAIVVEGDDRLGVPIANRWQAGRYGNETAPVIASGGWQSAQTLRVELIFVETPHRLILECALGDRTFTARWVVAPRRTSPLSSLRAPLSLTESVRSILPQL